MPAGAVAGASAVYGAYSANKASQQQSHAMNMQQQAANAQLALEQQFMQQQQGLYGPLERQMVQEASSTQPLDYGLLAGNVQNQYGAAQRNLQASLASRGLSASGIASGANTGLEIGRANALSQAFQQGLDRRRQLAMGVLSRYNPGANVQGVAGAYGNQQNLYGQYAGMYGQAAQQGYGQVGQALGSLGAYFQTQQAQKAFDQNQAVQDYAGNNMSQPQIYQGPSGYTQMDTAQPYMPQQFGNTNLSAMGYLQPQAPDYSPYGGAPTVTIGTGTNTNTRGVS